MPTVRKPIPGGYIDRRNIKTMREKITIINSVIDEMTDQMDGVVEACEATTKLLNKKINMPYVPPAIAALSIIAVQMSRFNNNLTKIRNNVGIIITAAEENFRIYSESGLEVDELEEIQHQLDDIKTSLHQLLSSRE